MRFTDTFTELQGALGQGSHLAEPSGRRPSGGAPRTKPLPFVPFEQLKGELKRTAGALAEGGAAGAGDAVAGAGAGAHDPFFSLLGSATAAVDARFEQESRALLTGRPAGAGGLRGLASRMCASPGVVTPGGTERAAKAQWLRLYAKANAAAVRKIMKKYRKTHGSQEGAAPQVGAVRSPMMVELWAVAALDGGVEGGDGTADELKLLEPLFAEKMRKVLEQDEADADDLLCCCVCMDFVVDATALGCGHVYCELCAKRVAGVPPFAELCEAPETATCPMCRKPGVFGSAERLKNVDKLAQKQVTPREWKERKEFVRHEARTTGIRMIKA